MDSRASKVLGTIEEAMRKQIVSVITGKMMKRWKKRGQDIGRLQDLPDGRIMVYFIEIGK